MPTITERTFLICFLADYSQCLSDSLIYMLLDTLLQHCGESTTLIGCALYWRSGSRPPWLTQSIVRQVLGHCRPMRQ